MWCFSCRSGGGGSISFLGRFRHSIVFLRILIGGTNRASKKKKIGTCGSQFGEEMSELWCLEDLGMEVRHKPSRAAQELLKDALFIDQGAL